MPLWISLKVATLATFITIFLGVPTAYGMVVAPGVGRGWFGRSLLESALLLPLVLPPTVIGFALLWLLGDSGPLSAVSLNIVFTWWAAVLTAVVVALPLMYRSSRAAFEQIDPQLLAAARTLGASEWKVFRQVAIPLAGPGILAGTLLTFARALGEFGATLMLAGNIPGKTQTLPMAVYFAVEGGDWRTATVWSGVMGAIALLLVASANTLANSVQHSRPRKRSRTRGSSRTGQGPSRAAPSVHPIENRPVAPLSLSVDITRQLPDFTLRVQFNSAVSLLSILGASGAGKSFLLKCLAGIEPPDAGRIVLGDRVLYDSQLGINVPSCDRKIALLFQNYALFPHLTAWENVAFALPANSSQPASASALQALKAVQIEGMAHCYPYQLSGGQQQRVALARALASEPELLLLDEPFSALDTHLRSRIARQLFDRIHRYQGKTVLVTHSLKEAYQAQQLVVMHKGESVRQARPAEVFANPLRLSIAQLTGPINQSPGRLVGDCIQAVYWRLSLQMSEGEIATARRFASQPLSVGIRPRHVSFVTESMYNSHQPTPHQAVKITTSDLADLSNKSLNESFNDLLDSSSAGNNANQSPCWLVDYWLQPASVVVLVTLISPAHRSADDGQLQAIISYATWTQLQQQPLPWKVYLPPEHLIVLRP